MASRNETGEKASSSALRRLILLGTPLALAVPMLFYPSPYGDVAGELVPIAGWWTILHTLQFVLFASMGAAVWMLVGGMGGFAAAVARVGAAVFAIFYDAGDAIAGISTGILAGAAGNGTLGEHAAVEAVEALFAAPTKNLMFQIGAYAWIAALVAAAVSLYRAGAPREQRHAPAAYFMNFDHTFPFGSLTFASFPLAALCPEFGPRPSPSLRGPGA